MEAMTNRVLRWLFAVALGLLALDAAFNFNALPWFVAHFPMVIGWGPEYILGYLVLPTTATSIGEVTGVAALVVSLQRRQWGWFSGMLLCLVVANYAGLALEFPGSITVLSKLSGEASVYYLTMAVRLYFVLALTPLVVLVGIYSWTRRQPAATTAVA
jgi:hypothetical protein